MQLNQRNIVQWSHNTVLASGTTVTLALGTEGSGEAVAIADDVHFFTYGIFASHTCRLEVEGSFSFGFAAADTDTLFTHAVAATTYTTPYLLSAPVGQNGLVVLTRPFIRLKLVETNTATHTKTHLYAKAWW